VAEVVLRWLIRQDGVIALSRTAHAERAAQNLHIFDFELTAAEMADIHALAQANRRIVEPPGLAPRWDPTRCGGAGYRAPLTVHGTSARSVS
jgi:diketogulonate reductase-like aldo/keto reductase